MAGSKNQTQAARQPPSRNTAVTATQNAASADCPVEETDAERAAQIAQLDISELVTDHKKLINWLQSDFGGYSRGQGGSVSAQRFHDLLDHTFVLSQRTERLVFAVESVKKPTAAAMEEALKRVPKASDVQAEAIEQLKNTVRNLSLLQERGKEDAAKLEKEVVRLSSENTSLKYGMADMKKAVGKHMKNVPVGVGSPHCEHDSMARTVKQLQTRLDDFRKTHLADIGRVSDRHDLVSDSLEDLWADIAELKQKQETCARELKEQSGKRMQTSDKVAGSVLNFNKLAEKHNTLADCYRKLKAANETLTNRVQDFEGKAHEQCSVDEFLPKSEARRIEKTIANVKKALNRTMQKTQEKLNKCVEQVDGQEKAIDSLCLFANDTTKYTGELSDGIKQLKRSICNPSKDDNDHPSSPPRLQASCMQATDKHTDNAKASANQAQPAFAGSATDAPTGREQAADDFALRDQDLLSMSDAMQPLEEETAAAAYEMPNDDQQDDAEKEDYETYYEENYEQYDREFSHAFDRHG